MQPEISVVIPLYNKEKYIQRTIDSVLQQSFQNFECIIIDSSDDGSTEIVKRYSDPRIRHTIRKQRTYLPTSRNIGVSLSQTNLIAFIDADDEWMPGHLEAITTLSKKFPDAGVFATPYIKLRSDWKPMVMIFADIPPPPWEGTIRNYFRTCSRGDVPVSSSSSAVKKNTFHEIGGFDETLIYGGEDQHFWGRIALNYPVAFTWNGCAIYHTEAEGRMCNNPRPYVGDPLSTHLKELLNEGSIPTDIIHDVKAYIHRRQKTVSVSQFLGKYERKRDERIGIEAFKKPLWKGLAVRVLYPFSNFIAIFLNSRYYNTIRWLWCYIHGWHIPQLK